MYDGVPMMIPDVVIDSSSVDELIARAASCPRFRGQLADLTSDARVLASAPVRSNFSPLPPAACVLCALRSTLLSSQEVAARSAYARSKPG